MEDIYIEICAAIVKQAKRDYKEALRDPQSRKAQYTQKECERFFLSEWGALVTCDHGAQIIEQCKKEIENERGQQK